MNRSQPKDRGKYSWTFSGGNTKAKDWVAEATWDSSLDCSDSLTVRFVLPTKQELSLDDLPKSAELKWQDRVFFKGHLQGFSRVTPHVVEGTYKDALYKTERYESNALVQDCTLQDALDTLARVAGLTTRFHGTFADSVSSRYLGGKTVFRHLEELSQEYGFFFFSHAPSEVLHFYRLGAETSTAAVDWKEDVARFSSDVRSDLLVSGVDHRYFDPATQTGKTQTLRESDLYSPVQPLTQHDSFRAKKDWVYAKGHRSLKSEGKLAAQSVESVAKNSLSKQALFQEGVWLRFWKPVAMPGDTLDVKGAGPVLSGKYLVHSARLPIGTAHPYLDLRVVRP